MAEIEGRTLPRTGLINGNALASRAIHNRVARGTVSPATGPIHPEIGKAWVGRKVSYDSLVLGRPPYQVELSRYPKTTGHGETEIKRYLGRPGSYQEQ